jgi:hypothetical protein
LPSTSLSPVPVASDPGRLLTPGPLILPCRPLYRKAGFPKLKDAGLVDCLIGGEGISATIVLETAPASSQSVFVVRDVKAHVGTLKIATREMTHQFLYRVVLPLVSGLIKSKIARSIENSIRTTLQYADTQLAAVRRELKEANSEPGAPSFLPSQLARMTLD